MKLSPQVCIALGHWLVETVVQNPSSYQFERSMTRMQAAEATVCNWDQVSLGDKLLPISLRAIDKVVLHVVLLQLQTVHGTDQSAKTFSVFSSGSPVCHAVYTHMGRHQTRLRQQPSYA